MKIIQFTNLYLKLILIIRDVTHAKFLFEYVDFFMTLDTTYILC